MGDIFDLSSCTLCPRECKSDRTNGKRGVCGADDKIYAARAKLHLWEEPCISGDTGSGTVFFTGCNLKCVFCQNKEISLKDKGYEISEERLIEIFFELKESGAKNINLVTAAHFLPQVLKAVKKAKEQNIKIPFVYNSSGYERAEAIMRAEGLIDIYLPDFKYINEKTAKKYSNASDYPKIAKEAIAEMVRQQNKVQFDEDGMMTKGVIVRHMMLPEGLSESKQVLKYLYDTYKDDIYISIMNQYTPVGNLEAYPELKKRVKDKDYERLIDYAISKGISNAYIQEGETASESFIPDFFGQGIVKED